MLTAQEKRFQLQSIPAETVTRVAINEACVIRTERWFPHVHTRAHAGGFGPFTFTPIKHLASALFRSPDGQ